MKILMLIDQKYPTNHVFLEEVYSKIFRKKGHKVVWVMKSKIPIKKRTIKFWNDNKVYVIPTRYPGILEYFFQILDLIFLFKLCKKEEFDIVQVRNDPIMGLLAYFLAKKNKIKFIVQLSHLKAEETLLFAKRGIYGSKYKNYAVAKIEKFLRQIMLKKADLIFPISDEMKKYFLKKGINQSKMVALPLGVDSNINPKRYITYGLKKNHHLKNEKILIYIGTLNRSRKLEIMLKALELIKLKFPKIKLFILGEGKEKKDLILLKNICKKLNIEKEVIFTGNIPRTEVPKYLKLADIGLSPVPFNEVFKRSSITKLGEYMNMGLPVIATKFPEQYKLVKESGAGFCVDYNVQNFAEAILEMILMSKKKRKMLGNKGRRYIRKERNLNKLAELTEKSYLRLLNNEKNIITAN